jgi:hypothetical protein
MVLLTFSTLRECAADILNLGEVIQNVLLTFSTLRECAADVLNLER